MRGCIIWRIVLARAKGRAAAPSASSIGDRDAGGTQRSYPVLPRPARGAAPLILRGVVSAVAQLALPRIREGGSRSLRARHSAENQKWGIWSAFENFEEESKYQFRLVELTCGALGTNQNSAPHINRRESQRETQLSVVLQ